MTNKQSSKKTTIPGPPPEPGNGPVVGETAVKKSKAELNKELAAVMGQPKSIERTNKIIELRKQIAAC